MYQCISIAYLKPDKVDEVLAAAQELAEITHKQKGNLEYYVAKPEGKENTLIMIEKWETEADFQAHVDPNGEGAEAMGKFVSVIEPASEKPSDLYPGPVVG